MQNNYIKEWSDIQNIVVDKKYNKFVLDELNANSEDVCEKIPLNKCELAAQCVQWKSACVNKQRIQKMHTSDVILTSKTYKIQFRVLDSMLMSKVQLTTSSVDMYYCMVESISTGVIYVLFSSGIVLNRQDLYENNDLNDHIKLLSLKIIEFAKNGRTIVLGGHSMGCVLAMYTGWKLYSMKRDVFTRNIYVIGTAGAKWMTPEIAAEYGEHPNIVNFVSGELRKTKTKQKMMIDCFHVDGDADFIAFTKPKLLYYDTEDEDRIAHVDEELLRIDADKSDTISEITLTYTPKNSAQCKKLHMWKYYMELLHGTYCKDETNADETQLYKHVYMRKNNTHKSKTQHHRQTVKSKQKLSK